MLKLKYLLIFLFITISLILVFYLNRNSKGTLVIEASSLSDVYINDEFKGTTPYEVTLKIGDYDVSVNPKDTKLAKYTQRVTMFSGVKTIVRRRFGEGQSGGEVVFLEKDKPNRSNIAIVTRPVGAKIYVNEKYIDVSPIKIYDVSPGQYKIKVRSDRFLDQDLDILVTKGYTVNVIFDLVSDLSYQKPKYALPVSSDSDILSKTIIITDGNDDISVISIRKNANINSTKIGEVQIGEEYDFLDYIDGWYEIEIKDGDEKIKGWISEKYTSIKNSND